MTETRQVFSVARELEARTRRPRKFQSQPESHDDYDNPRLVPPSSQEGGSRETGDEADRPFQRRVGAGAAQG